jgi:hypothetical protein
MLAKPAQLEMADLKDRFGNFDRRKTTLRSLGQRVTQLSLARLRQAPLWNCCATASLMIERSQINSDG